MNSFPPFTFWLGIDIGMLIGALLVVGVWSAAELKLKRQRRRNNEQLRAEVQCWMRECDHWRDEAFRASGFTPPAHLAGYITQMTEPNAALHPK